MAARKKEDAFLEVLIEHMEKLFQVRFQASGVGNPLKRPLTAWKFCRATRTSWPRLWTGSSIIVMAGKTGKRCSKLWLSF